ncbi:MAG: sigma-E factor negative regulatory protein [Pseudomonadales bacterium]|jgi:negative regulator of sigma E activity|nr:sigma-E factor negative regulatory protein [Pseudomonadales bacterium]
MNSSKDGFSGKAELVQLREGEPFEDSQRMDREALSALMDDEATELEIRRLVRRLPQQPELLATWKRYQRINAVLHESPIRPDLDLLPGIQAALAADAAPSKTQRVAGRLLRLTGQGAIAASVAAFVLVGAGSLEIAERSATDEQQQPQLAGEYKPSEYERVVRLDSAARARLQQAVYQFSSTPREGDELPSTPATPLILELELR